MNEYSITVQILVVQNLNVQPHTASKCQNQSSRTGWSAGSKLTQTCQAALRPWAHQLSHWWLSTSTTQGLFSKPFRIPCLKQFISSVHFTHSGIPDSLWPHGLQHASFPVHHQLPGFAQTQVHWVTDAIQPSHPLSSTSPPTFNPSQHQGLFQWVSSSHQEAKYWSFSFSISPSSEYSGLIFFRVDWLISLQSKGLSRVFSNTTVQKHQFFSTQFSL